LKKIRIKRYPPRNFPDKSLWEIIAVPPKSEQDTEFMMLYKANPKHPAIIEEMTEVVEIEVNEKAFNELMWLFKKYEVPCKPLIKIGKPPNFFGKQIIFLHETFKLR
jgi:hypothetical protein